VGALQEVFASGSEVTPAALRDSGLAKGIWDEIKILGGGEIKHALKVSAHHFSSQAREKIAAAGGTVTELAGPAPVVRKVKKASRKRPAGG
jgi:large subunit ribosomal protein L15